MKKEDFQFHNVTAEENRRLQNAAYKTYVGDVHGQGGEHVTSQLFKVEEYIKLLEGKVTEYANEIEKLTNELKTIKHNQELTVKWARGEIEN